MRARFAYLAYPIDYAGQQTDWLDLVNAMEAALIKWNIGVYDPGDAFTLPSALEVGPEIAAINNMALGRCQVVVAMLPPGVASLGVGIEIERAWVNGIPVAIVGGSGSWSVARNWGDGVKRFDWSASGIEAAVGWLAYRKVQERVVGAPEKVPFIVGENGQLPNRGYEDDAGLDLFVSELTLVEPGEFIDVPCDLKVELPHWAWGMITGRSSTLRTRGLLVPTSIVDTGWRGDLAVGVWNISPEVVEVAKGDRLGQLIVMSNQTRLVDPVAVQELSPHPRGTNGFGSTGR